jgi:hypothetical protein
MWGHEFVTASTLDVSVGVSSHPFMPDKRLLARIKSRIARFVFVLSSCLLLLAPLPQMYSSASNSLPSPVTQLQMTLPAAPGQLWNAFSAANVVDVNLIAGDTGISKPTLHWVQSVIRTDAWPVIAHLFAGASVSDVNLVLFATEKGYEQAVAQQFAGNAKEIAARTGGFTVGTTVYVPIYKYSATDTLANTVAHEFTHVFLNVTGVSRRIPEWMNEGFAWTAGLKAETAVNSVGVQSLLQGLASKLSSARQSGNLAPLTTGTTAGLQKNFEYNLEYEDYLAVQQLERVYGTEVMKQFFRQALDVGLKKSFEASFGMSLDAYEQMFYGNLTASS